ncbi:MAG: hypothetical protein II825_03710 [Paludibacteraceae bacterium]|nr:hypothetical protein [Paludibacteraceae bacterium]
MIPEQFKLIKEDLKREYASILCPESLAFIDKAETLADLVSVLRTYMVVIACKPIPTDEWVRKWFKYDLAGLNALGIYLDQTATIEDPAQDIVCFGRCCLTLNFNQPKVWNILLYGTSIAVLNTHTICSVNVRARDNSSALAPIKYRGSIIKIRRV